MGRPLDSRPVRFVSVGVAATAVHFSILFLCLNWLKIPSAGASNMIAAVGGIGISFFGNRHYVHRSASQPLLPQFQRFWLLYLFLCLVQGLVLFLWSDIAGFDYRVGFVLGVMIQAICTYYGGLLWVFKHAN